jgi:hypothetical protein
MPCLAEPHARSASVFVDELDTSGLKGTANRKIIGRGQRSLHVGLLGSSNCRQAESRLFCEILRTPADKPTRRSNLGTGQ